jgi:hypothetical protein
VLASCFKKEELLMKKALVDKYFVDQNQPEKRSAVTES